jgi:hypothetical protein
MSVFALHFLSSYLDYLLREWSAAHMAVRDFEMPLLLKYTHMFFLLNSSWVKTSLAL